MWHSPEATAVYDELRRIAAVHLSRAARQPSIQPTQLVHEAWIRLHDRGWKSKTHFLSLASRAMRMVLVDAVRARMAAKRSGGMERVTWGQGLEAPASMPIEDVIAVDRVLNQLESKDKRKALVVEMRFFGGLEFGEIAEAINISESTAKRDWEFARTWMFAKLSAGRLEGGR
ncbi:MAG: RNA polymerase subunit sigma-70 [Bryobacterales bacterium]|nr:RNA polymerase subunit sigma-70 [Bryobacterales bacterium]